MSIYRVLLDDQLITETESEMAAWATYRAQLRRGDLRAAHPLALIEVDGNELHSAYCDGRAAEIDVGVTTTPNAVLKALMAGRYIVPDIKRAAHDMGYPLSNSRMQGWIAGANNSKYQAMTLDELLVIVEGLPR